MSNKAAALHAGKIAGALLPAERSLNAAAIDLLAVGTKLFEARNSGHFHPLEGQRAVERLGHGMSKLVEAIGDVARAHDEFVKVAVKHQVMDEGTGQNCPFPDGPHGEHAPDDGNVILMPVAA